MACRQADRRGARIAYERAASPDPTFVPDQYCDQRNSTV